MIDIEIPRVSTPKRRPILEQDQEKDCYILRIDNTSLEAFQTCARRSEYYLLHRRQKAPSAALAYGGALHEGLESFYKSSRGNAAQLQAIQVAVRDYSKFKTGPNEWRTIDHLATVLARYFAHWEGNDFIPEPLPNSGVPAVELPFSITLGHIELDCQVPYSKALLVGGDDEQPLFIKQLTVLWSGKIDLGIMHQDELAIVDHKTTSIAGPQFFEQFLLSQPVHGYAWAMAKMFEKPVNKFVLNAIIMRKPTRTGVGLEFDRKVYNITPQAIEEWKRDVESEIAVFVDHLTTGYFPKAPIWCMGKYGKCPYHDVCTMPADVRLTLLNSDLYSHVNWSPLHKD